MRIDFGLKIRLIWMKGLGKMEGFQGLFFRVFVFGAITFLYFFSVTITSLCFAYLPIFYLEPFSYLINSFSQFPFPFIYLY
jgi:hypothetical protein